jgi:predicted helicase
MQHFFKENIALISPKQFKEQSGAFITDSIADHKSVSAFDTNYIFPLYLYPPSEEKKKKGIQAMMLFEPEEAYGKKGKVPNIAAKVIAQLERAYNKKFIPSPSGRVREGLTPEQVMYYCYAVLYSNIYREKYAEFLKIDFPRIPFTADKDLFAEMSALGEELASLHLLKHKSLSHPTTKYFGKGGSDKIEKPVYDVETERVYINEARYFDNITKEVWEYQVGGYQPMEKYLKDRKGRQMDDPAHYCKMATAILKTIELQKKADILFAKAEKKVIEIKQ